MMVRGEEVGPFTREEHLLDLLTDQEDQVSIPGPAAAHAVRVEILVRRGQFRAPEPECELEPASALAM